jgi:histone-lysine N-methyltransferase SETD2
MSSHDNADSPSSSVANAVTAMKIEQHDGAADMLLSNGGDAVLKHDPNGLSEHAVTTKDYPEMDDLASSAIKSRTSSLTPIKSENGDSTAKEEKVGGDITVKMEPGQPPKLSRSSSQKVVAQPPQLFLHLPDSTAEAQSTFEVMETCTYANKYMGYTEHAMECDCAEEWGKLCFFFPFSLFLFFSLLWLLLFTTIFHLSGVPPSFFSDARSWVPCPRNRG